jgi:hypothetical protein
MKDFQRWMATWEAIESEELLKHVPPTLQPGEEEIVTHFQDESCMHANDATGSAWLQEDEQPLQKKRRRSCFIHVSDFINIKTGRLVVRDDTKQVIRDVQEVLEAPP